MVPVHDTTPGGLRTRFIAEAEKLSATVHQPASDSEAVAQIMKLISDDKKVLSWDFAHLPLQGLQTALTDARIEVADARDDSVRVGITGCEAALAATGSLVAASGTGKARSASLLAAVHIAIVRADQIQVDFETWIEQQRQQGLDTFRAVANVVLISGPSRTADIAGELNLGVHGPGELYIILLS